MVEMDNCGSKLGLIDSLVKEQRVDDSSVNRYLITVWCTLVTYK